MTTAYTHRIDVIKTVNIYPGEREIVATFHGDAAIFAQLWIQDHACSCGCQYGIAYHTERRPELTA